MIAPAFQRFQISGEHWLIPGFAIQLVDNHRLRLCRSCISAGLGLLTEGENNTYALPYPSSTAILRFEAIIGCSIPARGEISERTTCSLHGRVVRVPNCSSTGGHAKKDRIKQGVYTKD